MRPFLTAYFLLFATAFASPVFSADDEVIVLESAVQQNVASLAKSSVPKTIITRISSTREVLNKGNFGKSIHFDSKYMYSRREDGLWVIGGGGSLRGGSTGGTGQSLSLCGLATLINVSSSSGRIDTSAILPIGRAFIPFGIQSTTDMTRKFRVTSLETSYKDICAPKPGEEFSFRMETETQARISGTFSRSNVVNGIDEISCKVAADPKPATGSLAIFNVETLGVSCSRKVKSGEKIDLEYVFLRDAGLYLQLQEKADVQSASTQYMEIEFAK